MIWAHDDFGPVAEDAASDDLRQLVFSFKGAYHNRIDANVFNELAVQKTTFCQVL